MATIFGDVQYSQVMGHLPTPEISATMSFRAWSACAYHSIYTKIGRMIAPIAEFAL